MADEERTRRADVGGEPMRVRGSRSTRFMVIVAAALLVGVPGGEAGRAGHYFSFNPDANLMGKQTVGSGTADHMRLVKGGPHMTFSDPGNLLEAATLSAGVTVEAWTCIRDRRVLAPPLPTDANERGVTNPTGFWRIPVAGNMQHSAQQGYQLECGWNVAKAGPECCVTAYMQCGAQESNAGQPEVEACVSLKAEPSGSPALASASTCAAHQWVHLSGTVENGATTMTVTTANGTRITANGGRVAQACDSPLMSLGADLAFRVGGQIPFRDTGVLFPMSQDSDGGGNINYFFYRGDIDEVRVFGKVRTSLQAYDSFELISAGPTQCLIKDQGTAGVITSMASIPRKGGEFESPVKPPTSTTNTIASNDLTGSTQLPELSSNKAFAYKVTIKEASTLTRVAGAAAYQCPASPTEVFYTDADPCGQNYMDRRPAVLMGLVATNVRLSTGMVAPAEHVWRFKEGERGQADWVIAVNNYLDLLQPTSWLINNRKLALDYPANFPLAEDEWKYGLPFENVGASYLSFKENKFALDSSIADVADVVTQFLPKEVPLCSTGNCMRMLVQWDLTHLRAEKAQDCHGTHNGTAYPFLCYEWWVPFGRGWRTLFKYRHQTPTAPCLPTASEMTTFKYASRIGYEATPEWFSRDEFPKVTAAGGTRAATDYFSVAICPVPNERFEAMVGVAMQVITFRARDRNKDDAVDIRPLDDPGLPNGAVLIPALFTDDGAKIYARESQASTLDRPKIYDREFHFTPSASQHGTTYKVCFRATTRLAPIISSNVLYTPFRLTDAQYADAVGDTVSTRPAAADQPEVWTDRCVDIAVASPVASFGCSLSNAGACTARNNSELDFTAGDAACSTTLELWAVDARCAGLDRSACQPYGMQVSVDPNYPGPNGFTVTRDLSNQAEAKYSATWLPTAGKDENEEGYKVCLIASDVFGISKEKRCYVLRVRKCKYCWFDGETLESIGHQFGLDWLQMYMANPHIKTPDTLQPQNKVINVGAVYKVRAGDYLALLAQRFFMSEAQIRRLNPDIPMTGVIKPGLAMCVMPPVCDVQCLYGTDCHVY